MKKKILAVGVVILLIGAVLATIGYTGMLNKKPEELADDYDRGNREYASYDGGDTVTVTGEITNEESMSMFGESVYVYEMNNIDDWGFIASEKIGDEGEKVTVELEVEEGSIAGQSGEYMEARSVQNISLMMTLGIIIAIVGIIVTIVGAVKSGETEEFEERERQEPPKEEVENF